MSSQSGPGWIGGDATYSTALPDGREAFVFSDTLIGTVRPHGGPATITGVPRNSQLVGTLSHLRSEYGGTYRFPKPLIRDGRGKDDGWQVSATFVENGQQLVFVNEFSVVSGSTYGHYTGRSGIAVLSVAPNGKPDLTSITPVPTDPDTQWGNAVTQDAFYTYVYGDDTDDRGGRGRSAGTFVGMKLARVPRGHSLNLAQWQFWDGDSWIQKEAGAAPISTTNELTGVAGQPAGIGYMAVSIPHGIGNDWTLDVSYACSPQGPWTSPDPVYLIPEVTRYRNEIAYIPTFHPELSGHGGLVVSYNIDGTDGLTTLAGNVHLYQPRFLQLNASPEISAGLRRMQPGDRGG